jgi:peptidyl-prolyl cis-trans isomerase SurA|tara:strand:- start:1424 stop:2350 length:927 start_codon:yes stop_codon:yes gene_type:complete
MIKKINLIILLIFFTLSIKAHSENKVFLVYKINNQIITNVDVEYEKKYLVALNNKLKSLSDEQLNIIAKESLQREKIKKIELERYYSLDQSNQMLNTVVEDLYRKLEFKNKENFEIYLNEYGLEINDIIKKIEIENTWNQLVYSLFKDQVYIDKPKLKKKINKKKILNKSYLLSEIVFENIKQELQQENIKRIKISINEIGFENTANLFSISESKKFGGKIGWIEERLLSDVLVMSIKNLKISEHTMPISMGANSVILKVEDVKIENLEIDQDKELKKLVQFETNKQLERFSLIHFNRIKLNTIIDVL